MTSQPLSTLTMPKLVPLICSIGFVAALASASAAEPDNIKIEGDSAVFDQASNTITYAGAVKAIQGTLMISGDKRAGEPVV